MKIEIYKTIGGENTLYTATVNEMIIIDNNSKLPMVIYTNSLQAILDYLDSVEQGKLKISSRELFEEGSAVEYEWVETLQTRH